MYKYYKNIIQHNKITKHLTKIKTENIKIKTDSKY